MRHTAKTKAKLSKIRKGSANPFFGKTHTPEVKARLSKRTLAQNAARQYIPAAQSIVIPNDPAILGYLAGMIDADGSIRFRKGRPFVAIYNTSTVLIDWVMEKLKHGSISIDRRGRRATLTWTIMGARDVWEFVKTIEPFLIVKRGDALKALAHIEEKYSWPR